MRGSQQKGKQKRNPKRVLEFAPGEGGEQVYVRNDAEGFKNFAKNVYEKNRSQLPQPSFSNNGLFTPLRPGESGEDVRMDETNTNVNTQLPDGLFYFKGEEGVKMFRQIFGVETNNGGVVVDELKTPDAPRKINKQHGFQ